MKLILLITLPFLLLIPAWSSSLTTKPESKRGPMDIKFIEELYNGVSGFGINSDEEEAVRRIGSSPVYGEIKPEAVSQLEEYLKLTAHDVFYDLGSGVGKMVVQIYLDTPVKKSVGIELSPTRSNKAQSVKEKLKQQRLLDPKRILEFRTEDIMNSDISDATVIYLASTCLSDEYMKKITDRLAQLKKGLRVLTLRKLPPHKDFKEITQLTAPMTWSTGSTIHVYELIPQTNASPIKMVSRK